jgi:hypothetical protein
MESEKFDIKTKEEQINELIHKRGYLKVKVLYESKGESFLVNKKNKTYTILIILECLSLLLTLFYNYSKISERVLS